MAFHQINFRYLKTAFYASTATFCYIISDIMIRKIINQFDLDISFFYIIQCAIQLIILIIIGRAFKQCFKTRYFVFYLVKAVIFVFGIICWGRGIRNLMMPMYLVSLTSFMMPISVRLLSCIFGTSAWHRYVDIIMLFIISSVPVLTYIYDSFFSHEFVYLMTAYTMYGIIDFMNELNLSKSNHMITRISRSFAEYRDSLFSCIFNNVLSTMIMFIAYTFYKFRLTSMWSIEIDKIISMPSLDIIFYITNSIITMIALFCMCRSFRLTGAAAAQIFKSFEPLICGGLLSAMILPEIQIASLFFLIAIVLSIIQDCISIEKVA